MKRPNFEYYLAEVPMKRGRVVTHRQDWRWRLRAANGEIVASGEGYSTKSNVKRFVARLKRISGTAGIVEC